MKKTNEKLEYDRLLAQQKSLLRRLSKVEEPFLKQLSEIEEKKAKALPEKVTQINELLRTQGRARYTDEEFEIVVLLEPWRRGGGRKDHC